MSKLPPDLLQDVQKLNQALKKDKTILNNTRLKDIDLSGLKLENIELENIRWRRVKLDGAQWSNVTIEKADWEGVTLENAQLNNVTFKDSEFKVDDDILRGNTTFSNVVVNDVTFIDCYLLEVMFQEIPEGNLVFIDSEIITKTKKYHDNIFQWTGSIAGDNIDLQLKNCKVYKLFFTSRVTPANILIENTHYVKGRISGKVKSLIIKDSAYEGICGKETDYAFIENSKVDIAFPQAKFVHLKNNTYIDDKTGIGTGISIGDVSTAIVDGCKAVTHFNRGEGKDRSKGKVQNLYIRNCTLREPFFPDTQTGFMELSNVKILIDPKGYSHVKYSWENCAIRQLNLYNVEFTNNLPEAKGLSVDILATDGKHPIPERLKEATKQYKELGEPPPLPDTEKLKRKALEENIQQSPLTSIFNRTTQDAYYWHPQPSARELQQRTVAEKSNPFNLVHTNKDQLVIPFNHLWLDNYSHYYNLAAQLQPPPFKSASLFLCDLLKLTQPDAIDYLTNRIDYKASEPNTKYPHALWMEPVNTTDVFEYPKIIGKYRIVAPLLCLWLEKPEFPINYDHQKHWVVGLWTLAPEGFESLDPERNFLQAKPLWKYINNELSKIDAPLLEREA